MNDESKLPPDREPLRSDWFVAKLGNSQQKVMSLTAANRRLETRLEKIEERSEVLEELVMDVVADMQDNVLKSVILERINKVMRGLDEDG